MKRADQHNVSANSPVKDNQDQSFLNPEQTGIDMPSEKDIPLPEQQEAPSMGALPVDTIGRTKSGGDWKTNALEETHANNDSREDLDAEEEAEEEFIATGEGPDPENADN
jgi:hypothetical protein